jgi:23S rRNA (cytidine2498-2'-O)-methyltransferase
LEFVMVGDLEDKSMILTSHPQSGRAALREVQAVDSDARLHGWLSPGVGWVALSLGWETAATRLREQPPVFCRHICPVQVSVPLAQNGAGLDALAAAGEWLTSRLDPARTFSVQTRQFGQGWTYARYDVNQRLSEIWIGQGYRLNVRQPEQVVSVVLTPEQGFLGVSWAADNLSDWAGGARRFKREEGQISRAEFKLLEALELFGLETPAGGLALDLGAAPGGWTRVLRTRSMRVVAVDPGDIDSRLAADPEVRHECQTAETYLRTAQERFDVILNDMRMDAIDSARTMVRASDLLQLGGWAVMTLKLPKRSLAKTAAAAIEVLRRRYDVIGARQLFHNRNEVTVALRGIDHG